MVDHDPRGEIETLRAALRSGDRYVQYERDRDLLLRMSDHIRLVPSEIGDHRHLKLLRHCSRMAQLAEPPTPADFVGPDRDTPEYDAEEIETRLEAKGLLGWALEERAAAQAIVRWIHSEYDNEHTNQDYRSALRSFGRYVLQEEEPPESLAWIPTGTSNDFDPVPSERDLLLWERDVQPMIEETRNARDAALIALQFEAGLRGGELFDLRVGDVFDSTHSMGVHVDGKQGERAVHLIVAVPYVQRWLSDHPTGDDGDWLWSKLTSPDRPSYNTWLGYFKNAAERAGVSKDVTPTNFRKSNMRWLVVRDLSQPEIEDRQGRVRGSDETARYMATFSDDAMERRYAAAHGKDVETEDQREVAPVECPRCGEDTPRNLDFCMHCSQALDLATKELLDDVKARLDERLVREDDPDAREDLLRGRRTLEQKPNVMDETELHDLASSLDGDADD
jgi:integrase